MDRFDEVISILAAGAERLARASRDAGRRRSDSGDRRVLNDTMEGGEIKHDTHTDMAGRNRPDRRARDSDSPVVQAA